jgi:hypothetical protein
MPLARTRRRCRLSRWPVSGTPPPPPHATEKAAARTTRSATRAAVVGSKAPPSKSSRRCNAPPVNYGSSRPRRMSRSAPYLCRICASRPCASTRSGSRQSGKQRARTGRTTDSSSRPRRNADGARQPPPELGPCSQEGPPRHGSVVTHDIRHTCVSLLLDLGVPPHVVRDIVGHSDIEVMLTICAHAALGEKRRALGKLGDALG